MTIRIFVLAVLFASLPSQVFAQWEAVSVNPGIHRAGDFITDLNTVAESRAEVLGLGYINVHPGTDFTYPSEYESTISEVMKAVRILPSYQSLSDSEINDLFVAAFLYAQIRSLSQGGNEFLCFWPCCPSLQPEPRPAMP